MNYKDFKKKKLNENVEMPALVNDDDLDFNATEDEHNEEEVQPVTFELFKEKVNEVIDEPIDDEVLNTIFDIAEDLFVTVEEEETEEGENEEGENEEEMLEEGILSFFKGGTDEEIEAKKNELTKELTDLTNKYKDKEIKFNVKGDDKTVKFNLADVIKEMDKNNFLGYLISGERNGKLYVVYVPGKKGMAKLAAGSGGSINTNR